MFPLLLAAVFGAYLYSSVGRVTPYSCTVLIPDSANVTLSANATVDGTFVTFSNGTNTFFSAGTCPQPVHQNLYDAVSVVTQDPRFVSEENGSEFTVDPTNSLAAPLTAPNGSTYEELIFNHLNLSDPIFPCNLNFVYSNPLAAIYVFVPVLPNGTYAYANDTIVEFPGNQLRFNCPQETGLTTYAKSRIPQQFQVGGFSFKLVGNGTNFVGDNGTSYPGFDYAFNVSYTQGNVTQQVVFTWPSAGALSSGQRPNPFLLAPYQAYVVMRWFTNATGLYFTVTTLY